MTTEEALLNSIVELLKKVPPECIKVDDFCEYSIGSVKVYDKAYLHHYKYSINGVQMSDKQGGRIMKIINDKLEQQRQENVNRKLKGIVENLKEFLKTINNWYKVVCIRC